MMEDVTCDCLPADGFDRCDPLYEGEFLDAFDNECAWIEVARQEAIKQAKIQEAADR